MHSVRVNLGSRSYSIHIGPCARTMLHPVNIPCLGDRPLVIVADEAVATLHSRTLTEALDRPAELLTFPPGEASKSLETAGRLYEQLAERRVDRDAVLLAFGGGVAGDLGGFVAATWLRGIRFVQVPTTLLAMIDAAVGGKTGVNLPVGKNLVGAFYQPQAVIADTDFLKTLPARELTAGLAESVKHAAICDADFLAWHEAHADELRAAAPDRLGELIAWNGRIKADVVARDEFESDLRAILNYGHTIGHAIEHLLEYELRHGECVGLGMLVENEIALARGLLDGADAARLRVLLPRLGLPVRLPRPLDPGQVIAACRLDKKVRAGQVHFVLLKQVGRPARVCDVVEEDVIRALAIIQPTLAENATPILPTT